jgi:hypothetical protein
MVDDNRAIGNDIRIDPSDLLRYSAIFAAIVGPAKVFGLGFPAIVVATWVVARQIARRYRRQITARETLQLACVSWVVPFLVWLVQTLAGNPSLGFFGFLFVWQALELVLVWTAYVWLARFVIGRALGTHIPVREPTSASDILARQQEQYAEANARTLTLAVAWLSIGMLGLPLIFLFGAIVTIVVGLMGFEVSAGTWFFTSAAVGLPALLTGWTYFISRKSAEVFPSHRLVLWLRRFHRADLMEFPFPFFLEHVCRGVAVPITLQDSTVGVARTAAALRPAFHVLRGVAMMAWFGLVISSVSLFGRESWSDSETVFLGIIATAGFVALVAVPIAVRHLGTLQLDTKRGRRLVRRLLAAIESHAGVPQTLTVVSTPDESWQSWVLEFMKRADAVLIDITRLSANLHWELQAIADHLDSGQVILAYGVAEGQEEEIPGDIQDQLRAILGQEMLDQSHRFFYTLPRHRLWAGFQRLTSSRRGWVPLSKVSAQLYSRRIAEALHQAFAASDRSAQSSVHADRLPELP